VGWHDLPGGERILTGLPTFCHEGNRARMPCNGDLQEYDGQTVIYICPPSPIFTGCGTLSAFPEMPFFCGFVARLEGGNRRTVRSSAEPLSLACARGSRCNLTIADHWVKKDADDIRFR
jgi:hypothetical protein